MDKCDFFTMLGFVLRSNEPCVLVKLLADMLQDDGGQMVGSKFRSAPELSSTYPLQLAAVFYGVHLSEINTDYCSTLLHD